MNDTFSLSGFSLRSLLLNILLFAGLLSALASDRSCRVWLTDSVLMVGAEVSELPEEAFRDRPEIAEVRFERGSKIKMLPTGLFRGCVNLRRVVLPHSLERIGAHAFAYCTRLEEISLPESLKRIGNNAFSRCSSLTRVSVPDSVTELESYAFSDCISLVEAKLPGNDSLLGELIFSGCERLRLLVEPSAVPPTFDCNSYIFEPEETALYRQCRLEVPAGSAEKYRSAPGWEKF